MSHNRKQTLVLGLLLALCLAMTAAFALSSISNALIFSIAFLASITIWQHQHAAKTANKLHHLKQSTHYLNQQLAIIETDEAGLISEANNNIMVLVGQAGTTTKPKTLADIFTDDAETMLAKNISNVIEVAITLSETQTLYFKAERHTTDSGYIFFFTDISDSKKLELMNLTDALTNTKNRRAFETEIDSMTKRAQRQDQYLTLAVFDIDNFGEFNDQYGHEAGDEALVQLAESLRHTLRRATDHIYRIGGDEFVAVFEGDTPNICRRALENLVGEFENRHIPNPSPETTPFLTLSAGAFGARGKQLGDSDQLYMNADIQLFNAKEKRNCFSYLFPETGKPICVEPLSKRIEDTEQATI